MAIRVVQFGLGPIGQACVKVLLQKAGVEVAGAIDIDPAKVGRDLGEVCGLRRTTGLVVRGDAAAALAEWRPQVVVHTTSSFLNRIDEQLATIVRAGSHVVSSSEELFYPYERDPEFCRRLDALAQQHGVAVVATGVNPGFAMDILPLTLTGVCTAVRAIRITRVADASKRRLPFQQKIGAGLTPAQFRAKVRAGGFGHIGLRESALTILRRLGWQADQFIESLKPVRATRRITTPYLTVAKGQVTGIHQMLKCRQAGKDLLVFDWKMYVGAPESFDRVEIKGEPPLTMNIAGGIFGDTGTIGALVNTIPKVLQAAPGLRTTVELPVPHAFL
ncbi:MAG: dihydrodipicolinate reductase [candidate division KSB1 bacterium]|nr:dihydrodipicolinate reductase [candidate division KSB1 bacterium]MDZ7273095.1 dihydrodipicolinate reductase [candidate division KSB1 bacterium]MDZ7285198.1 dihydrodipicolinate reductase [candidate division KSB1 bacterium]MDZ7298230.1 dihydrodipicolinate reductase [candidate division KSB1 bacterium]MDZ7306732.1 dihydrodipicolinate reductase [candidate division KSB1 bacterium]